MRLYWLIGSLALALLIGVAALQVPRPAGAGAPPTAFSAERAMADVRALAQRPHPVGSADHARVRDVLLRQFAHIDHGAFRREGGRRRVGSHGARDLKRQHADQQRQRERSNQPEQPHETSSPMTRRP